jgi:hypothetical protein
MMLRRTLSLLVSLFAALLLPGCHSEQTLDCDADRVGELSKACFSRQCGDDECNPGPVLAGGEFAVVAKSGGSELEGVDYENVAFTTFAGGAQVLGSETSCLCDLSSDTCPEDVTDLVCTWTGRFLAPNAGELRVALRAPDGSGHDEYNVQAIEARSVRVAVVKADSFDLTAPKVVRQTLSPDAEGVVEVDAGEKNLFLIAAGLDESGRELTTLGGGFEHAFNDPKKDPLRDDGRSGPGQRFEAKTPGETTVTVRALAGGAQTTVRIRVR